MTIMSQTLLISLILLPILSILMVLAMIPFSMELISPSTTMTEHRRRLRGVGAPGVLTERLLPHWWDDRDPRRIWGIVYALTWLGVAAVIIVLTSASDEPSRLKDAAVGVAVVAGWWVVYLAIVWFGRAIVRANRRDARTATEDAVRNTSRGEARKPLNRHLGSMPPDGSEAPQSAENAPARSVGGLAGRLKSVALLFAVILLIGLASLAPTSSTAGSVEAFIAAHRSMLVGFTVSMAAAGFVVFMGGIIHMILHGGRPMSREEIEAMHARRMERRMGLKPVLWRRVGYRIQGEAHGRQGHDQFTLPELKQAWRAGVLWLDPVWRRRVITLLGALIMSLGIAGIVFVLAELWIQALVLVSVVYVLVRTGWALRQA